MNRLENRRIGRLAGVGSFTSAGELKEKVARRPKFLPKIVDRGFRALIFSITFQRFFVVAGRALCPAVATMPLDAGGRESCWILVPRKFAKVNSILVVAPAAAYFWGGPRIR